MRSGQYAFIAARTIFCLDNSGWIFLGIDGNMYAIVLYSWDSFALKLISGVQEIALFRETDYVELQIIRIFDTCSQHAALSG
jgi:hypothetical protein